LNSQEEKRKKRGAGVIFENVMAKNFPEEMKTIFIQIESEAQGISGKINTKKSQN
jgi:hypothetical protein